MGDIATGALNFLGGLVDTGVSVWQANKNREFQADEAEKNRQFQQYMYDRQMDDSIAWRTHQEQYNSPDAQMKRYRDAGINPMYAVTGNGGNMVTTPMSMTSGFGSSPSGGSQASSSVGSGLSNALSHLLQRQQMDINKRTSDANIGLVNAQANEADARAEKERALTEGIKSENVGKSLDADINNTLRNFYYSDGSSHHQMSYSQLYSEVLAYSLEYKYSYDAMSFLDAKSQFEHSKVMREFEKGLTEHKKQLFEHELSQAKSAAEVFRVTAKWAVPNQWINGATNVLGAAAGLVGSFKGTSLAPTMSRTYSESYGDHTSRIFHYNNE